MSLWIRSQDREGLLKVDTIDMKAETTSTGSILEDTYRTIETGRYFIIVNKYRVGVYGTKGQALEILDDIESLLCGNTMKTGFAKGIRIISENTQNLIYEMP